MTETTWAVRRGYVEDLKGLEPLWLAMVAHHWRVTGDAWPPREADDSWRRRRAAYAGWLEAGDGRLLLASERDRDEDAPLAGYAFLRVGAGGPTYDLGERVGELESLSVAQSLRGRGVGGALIEAARALLRGEGVTHWSVTYFEQNADAGRLYERAGFRPFNRILMGRVDAR